ncbi:hypothetical protein GCM10020256_70940 [Streptomyces thermocoprophilus]
MSSLVTGGGGAEGLAHEAAVHRQHQPAVEFGLGAGGEFDAERLRVLHRHGHRGEGRPGDLPGPFGEQAEHLGAFGAGHQAVRDLGGGPQPALPQPGLLVQAGVVDGDAGRDGEGGQHRLVLLVELEAAALLRQVQVAEDLVAHPDGDAEERVHRRVVRREAVGGGVLGQLG